MKMQETGILRNRSKANGRATSLKDKFERLLLSREKEGVIAEANEKMSKLTPEQFIKDQYVLEFLDLNSYPELRNRSLNRL